jgi:hypothetical protein
MEDLAPSRRPWFTHERTVLIVIALVVAFGLGWLGWQAQIVRHRQAVRKQINANGGYGMSDGFLPPAFVLVRAADRDCGISKIRRMLGDEEMPSIVFGDPLTAADREAINAFPEANVYEFRASPGPGAASQ